MIRYGVSYYPEHRSAEEMEKELLLLKESGMNVVRMGEFAWCKFEPRDGVFEFTWMDEAIEKMAGIGIDTILCTPTACPPAWLIEKYPEILYVDNRGFTRPFGGRRHYCYNNPIYRKYSERIAEEMARHYKDNPHVIAYQIDNELAQESTGRCHCDYCKGKFQKWLENKYKTIENLNERWGTIFWGQTYDHFGQINMPIATIEVGAEDPIYAYYDNPSLRLDYERFCSESNIEYQEIQRRALRKHTDVIITTNATGVATNSINYYESFKDLDVYAYDDYPSFRAQRLGSFAMAFARGVKNKNFWLLEYQSGGGHGLRGTGRLQPYPGALQQAAIHAFASGADLVAHFQFRTFLIGAEQLNYAIVDADGIPRRRFYEVKQAASDLKVLNDYLEKSKIINKVAICFDYDAYWALKIKPINEGVFDYVKYSREIYNTFVSMGIGVDVVSYNNELDNYDLVIVPTPFVMEEGFKNRLKDYVRNGGKLVTTFLAGAKNEDNVGMFESLPCGLTDLFGIRVGEVEHVTNETVSQVRINIGGHTAEGSNKYWTEVLEPVGAEVIGVYADTFRKGQALVSKNPYGKGYAYYIGTGFDSELLKTFLEGLAAECGIQGLPFKIGNGMEVIKRNMDGKEIYCIFNFLHSEVTLQLDSTYREILSNKELSGQIKIGPRGYMFLM